MHLLRRCAALALLPVAIAPAAHAGWRAPDPLAPAGPQSSVAGLGLEGGTRPAVLLQAHRGNRWTLALRRSGARGELGAPATVATSRSIVTTAGLVTGGVHERLIAAWLQRVGGVTRPVVATGPRLRGRQTLTAGPDGALDIDLASDEGGAAVVAYRGGDGADQSYIYVSDHRPDGRFEAPQLLATGRVGRPSVAIDEVGNAAVAWTDAAGVHVAQRAADAPAFSVPATIAAVLRPGFAASVALSGGRILVAWMDGVPYAPVTVLAAQGRVGQALGAPVAVSAAGIRSRLEAPAVALDGAAANVAWTQRDGQRDRVAVAVQPFVYGWRQPFLRDTRTRVYYLRMLGAVNGRPPMLALGTSVRGTLSATLSAKGTLTALHRLATGIGPADPWIAQGGAHSWLATRRNRGGARTTMLQPVLFRADRDPA